MDIKTFTVKYYKQGKFSHQYEETWEGTYLYCPSCGKKSVFHELSGGDFYVEEQYLCTHCESTFYLPGGVSNVSGCQDRQRLQELLEITPTESR